jgi:hypothetical protein
VVNPMQVLATWLVNVIKGDDVELNRLHSRSVDTDSSDEESVKYVSALTLRNNESLVFTAIQRPAMKYNRMVIGITMAESISKEEEELVMRNLFFYEDIAKLLTLVMRNDDMAIHLGRSLLEQLRVLFSNISMSTGYGTIRPIEKYLERANHHNCVYINFLETEYGWVDENSREFFSIQVPMFLFNKLF